MNQVAHKYRGDNDDNEDNDPCCKSGVVRRAYVLVSGYCLWDDPVHNFNYRPSWICIAKHKGAFLDARSSQSDLADA